jgi:hypothetical protein
MYLKEFGILFDCKMPRPCAVELHAGWLHHLYQLGLDATALCRGGSRSQLNSSERESPRGKPVASGNFVLILCSSKHEPPRDKPVASGNFVLILCSSKHEPPRDKPVASFDYWCKPRLRYDRRSSIER